MVLRFSLPPPQLHPRKVNSLQKLFKTQTTGHEFPPTPPYFYVKKTQVFFASPCSDPPPRPLPTRCSLCTLFFSNTGASGPHPTHPLAVCATQFVDLHQRPSSFFVAFFFPPPPSITGRPNQSPVRARRCPSLPSSFPFHPCLALVVVSLFLARVLRFFDFRFSSPPPTLWCSPLSSLPPPNPAPENLFPPSPQPTYIPSPFFFHGQHFNPHTFSPLCFRASNAASPCFPFLFEI